VAPSPLIRTAEHGPVRVLTLNRPERLNALDMPLRLELGDALEAAMAAPDVRAIVLTGAGRAFCAGGDITTMTRLDSAAASERAQAAQRVPRIIWSGPKPVLAAVEGPAYGAGAALALACDRVIAARGAKFSFTFARIGLAGDMGVHASLPARVGPARAQQMLMLAPTVTGEALQTTGLADLLVDDGTALAAAMANARALARSAPRALAAIKGQLRHNWTDVLDREVAAQVELFGSGDFAEGVAAFRQRRTPRFGGD
jgi:2-(1,2-epoxy-1,2-dihydrophenyl)acetyl-CoA isomerase